MIHCNGNVEFEVALNEEEVKWWQNRTVKLGGESEIISRDPIPIESLDEIADYVIAKGKQIFREALKGSEVAISAYQAYRLFHKCPEDPGSQALLEMVVNNYIQSKKFTLSIKDPDA